MYNCGNNKHELGDSYKFENDEHLMYLLKTGTAPPSGVLSPAFYEN